MISWEKYVADWSISKEEEKIIDEQYKDIQLLQITFSEFWRRAYKEKNNFFQHVFAEAKCHFTEAQKYEGKKLRISKELWHRHCDFCMKTITVEIQEACYCSEDLELWICAECFNDFKDHFEWTFEKIEDIPANAINNTMEVIIANK